MLAQESAVTNLIEVKHAESAMSPYFHRMAERFPEARAVQVVAELRQETQWGLIEVVSAAEWLSELTA